MNSSGSALPSFPVAQSQTAAAAAPQPQARGDLSYEALEGMTLASLKEQCKARGVPVSGTKATLIARLLPKKRGKPPANLSARYRP